MKSTKIARMHLRHGVSCGNKCGDCCNLRTLRHEQARKTYRKCAAYGVTSSAASDWAARHTACGLFGRDIREIPGLAPLMELEKAKMIEGQQELFDEEKEGDCMNRKDNSGKIILDLCGG